MQNKKPIATAFALIVGIASVSAAHGCGGEADDDGAAGHAADGSTDGKALSDGWFSCDTKNQNGDSDTPSHGCFEEPFPSGEMSKERAKAGCGAVNVRGGRGYSDADGCTRREPGCACTRAKLNDYVYQAPGSSDSTSMWSARDQLCVNDGGKFACFGGVDFTSHATPMEMTATPTKPNSNGWFCTVGDDGACGCLKGPNRAITGDSCTDESKVGCCFTFKISGVGDACQCHPTEKGSCEEWLQASSGTQVTTCPPE